MNFKNTILTLIAVLYLGIGHGQELNFSCSVMSQGFNTSFNTDEAIFKDLERNLNEFMNLTQWTEDNYRSHEKIRGSIKIIIKEEVAINAFRAEIIFQTDRPVFNTTYTTPLLNMIDKNVNFQYNGLLPFQKTTNTFYDNLSSIMSYYAYLALGFDYDSFSLNGGEPYFAKAFEVINSLSTAYAQDEGWKNSGVNRRNRYWIIENVQNPSMRQFRSAFYEYHKLCLDKMYDDADRSRAILLSQLTAIGQANIEYNNTMLIQVFSDTKSEEIVEIFQVADKGQKDKVSAIMVGMDPIKKSKYDALY